MLDRLRASCQQELASPHSILIASKNSEKKSSLLQHFWPRYTFLISAAFFFNRMTIKLFFNNTVSSEN